MDPKTQPRPSTLTSRVIYAMIWRAMTLRCPHCGSRRILANWFHLKEVCPRCGLHLHREEGDYYLGAYMVALFIMEGMFALGFVAVLVITWPNPPWDAIQYVGAAVMLLGVLAAYPFSQTLWLAIDLIFRPVSSTELGWYKGDSAVEAGSVLGREGDIDL